jgi:hypothetical protein
MRRKGLATSFDAWTEEIKKLEKMFENDSD